jgi:hypothetical protein
MSISAALEALYEERDRLAEERSRLDQAIAALEGIETPTKTRTAAKPKKRDGRSAPKPTISCPYCSESPRGWAGMAAHVRGSHPEHYPEAYQQWKQLQA